MSLRIPPTLFVHDRGQMCNNILQYGHAYAWAREHGYHALSMRFAYKYQFFHICHTPWHSFPFYALAKMAAKVRLLPIVDVDKLQIVNEEEQSRFLLKHRWVWVDGWQLRFPELFAKYLPDIRQLFAFDAAIEKSVQQLIMPYRAEGEVLLLGVHIRRGDYARFLGGKYFYDDPTMIHHIAQFQTLFPKKQIVAFICSNDPSILPSTYEQALPYIRFVFPKGNPGEDLCLLSHCDYLIGSPSTFSLVASMYRDIPIWWIPSHDATLTADSFSRFDPLFRQIDFFHSL